ncbi:protein PSK SIMULATOR 1-like [Argentina anserina]|uniref:protein PSK SIMULATOR 1-like n=1 Tax=Argentina anserina TaxID=57926 RepID=UPI0021764141|nr:protein PSK SIMULATOR 1-like [Potentilla anserina]
MVEGFRTKTSQQDPVVGIFAFEVARVMSKLVHLWESLSPKQVDSLMKYISGLVGIKKLVSQDEDIIRGFILRELFEDMIPLTKYVAGLGKNHCSDPRLKDFELALNDWITNGVDHFKCSYDLERTLKDTTATLDGPSLLEFHNKVELKRLEVENFKEGSLWNVTFDYVGILLARSFFTIISLFKSVFGAPQLMADAEAKDYYHTSPNPLDLSKYELLDAPSGTLGAAASELHYANIVIEIERLRGYPCLHTYAESRKQLYGMLPANVKAELSRRLPSIKDMTSSVLKDVAAKQKVATAESLEWLAPLAHNTKKMHSKRHCQHKACVSRSRSHLLLVQTLYFANQQKTEGTIVELLVGLQYSWQSEVDSTLGGLPRKAASLMTQMLRQASIPV